VAVDLDSAGSHRPLLGSGFNMEHALWSCPQFHSVLRNEILEPFRPSLARVDSGLLPAAPDELSARQLSPDVYASVLNSSPYLASWDFFKTLNSAGVKVLLGVWGGPPQFTDDGTRLGTLLPSHYDDYVNYVMAVVDFLVRVKQVRLWATTIANEPTAGTGTTSRPRA